jgi:peroxiredoxin family protein
MIRENHSKLALILQHASYEKFHLAATLAATTTAMGGEVHIFLSHEALFSFVDGKLDEAKPCFQSEKINRKYTEWLEDGKISGASALFIKAQKLGSIKFYGCSESVQLFHLGTEYTKKLDAVVGYTTFLDLASDARLLII